METINEIIKNFDFYYIFCVISCTFGLIFYFRPGAKKFLKIGISLFFGLFWGAIYFYCLKTPLNILLPSFTASVVFYAWLLKPILKFFNIDYETKDKVKKFNKEPFNY